MKDNNKKQHLIDNAQLIAEWNWEKNNELNLNPKLLTHGCTKKAHWICHKNHEYIARIDHRCIMKSGCPYCAGKLPIVGENDLATLHPTLLEEWDYTKNKMPPNQYKEGSNKTVWWKCKACQFEWRTSIANRALSNTGCPECAKIQRGNSRIKTCVKQNGSLADNKPDLLNEWNYELNLPITPNDLTEKSNKKVWWHCHNCNNDYKMTVSNKSNGLGCPICAGKVVVAGYNDFATTHPDLICEWHTTKNSGLSPSQLSAGSSKTVWWKCKTCSYEWKTPLYSRTSRKCGCPVCTNRKIVIGLNDLATTHPHLTKEWFVEKNGSLLPTDLVAGSNKKVWWKCSECNYVWKSSVCSRVSGCGCPKCAQKSRVSARINLILTQKGSLAENNPNLIKEWHPTKNTSITPTEVTSGSDKKVWWLCSKGHEWQATISSRVNGNGCPECAKELSTSFPEQAILYYLSKVTEAENRKKVFGYEIDIYLPELSAGVEYNSWYYHHNRKEFDNKKQKVLKENGIRLIRIEEYEEQTINIDKETSEDIICFSNRNKKKTAVESIIHKVLELLELPHLDINVERDEIKIYSQYIELKKSNSVAKKYPWLLNEWNYEKNQSLSPWSISYGSDKKVWWKCKKCNHEWQAAVSSRRKSGCPRCAGRKNNQ